MHLLKFKSRVLLLIVSALICSCQKENTQKPGQHDNYSDISVITEPGSEGLMEFAPQTENPYTPSNMQAALESLSEKNELRCEASRFNIRATHKYIKFTPADSIQAGLLIQDTSLILFDYPMDRKITKAGTYYRDPSLAEGQPDYQWTCVSIDKELPPGVPYEVLSELYIPEEDPELVQYYESEFDDCITFLIEEALKLTANYDSSESFDGLTDTVGGLKLPSKWTPAGRIRLTDNVLNTCDGLKGVKVRAHRWFETRENLTDGNGNFNVSHQFRFQVDYSIKWERKDYHIRSGRYGQAYFNGPHQRGNWDLDITTSNGISWHYGQVHSAAFDYYYNNQTGLRTPPVNGFLGSRIAIGVFDESNRADYRHWQRLWFGPEIRMYSNWEDGSKRTSLEQYQTTIHELSHASHFNLGHWHFRNSEDMIHESWALGVQWSFSRLRYPMHASNYQTLQLQYALGSDQFDVVHWGERKYTPLVIDLIDNYNQRDNNAGYTDFPLDRVIGYNIRAIEDALVQKRTMEAWREQLKLYKPAGVTDVLLNELFDNYIPLQ